MGNREHCRFEFISKSEERKGNKSKNKLWGFIYAVCICNKGSRVLEIKIGRTIKELYHYISSNYGGSVSLIYYLMIPVGNVEMCEKWIINSEYMKEYPGSTNERFNLSVMCILPQIFSQAFTLFGCTNGIDRSSYSGDRWGKQGLPTHSEIVSYIVSKTGEWLTIKGVCSFFGIIRKKNKDHASRYNTVSRRLLDICGKNVDGKYLVP